MNKSYLKMSIADLITIVSACISIGRYYRKHYPIKMRPINTNFLNKLSWMLISVAVLGVLILAPALFLLCLSFNLNPLLSLILSIAVLSAVFVPTMLAAKEDKIITKYF